MKFIRVIYGIVKGYSQSLKKKKWFNSIFSVAIFYFYFFNWFNSIFSVEFFYLINTIYYSQKYLQTKHCFIYEYIVFLIVFLILFTVIFSLK